MSHLIGIDLGTSGTKTVLFDETGKVIASDLAEYPLSQPRNGWAEQDPEDWWRAVRTTVRAVLAKSGVAAKDVKGVGISGQMHGLVMLDAANRVLRPSIIWCDQRTAAECEEIHRRVGKARLIELSANPALTGWTSTKILWVRNHEPEIYKRCAHILLPKDFIRQRLTGAFATEVSDASGMGLLEVPKRAWSSEILAKLEIDPALLAKVYESPEVTGTVTAEAAALTGLAAGTPVVGGAGDNAAAAVGTGVVEDGRAFATIGTSGVVFAHTSQVRIDPLGRVHSFCCAVPGAWHVMGVTQAAGLSLHWFRDAFCPGESYKDLDAKAAAIPIGANRLVYLPYLMGERTPHLDPDCRGAFIGLSAMHTKYDMLRAVLEGVVYSLKDCLGVLHEMKVDPAMLLACGGGGKSPLWRQMLADVFQRPVATIANEEGPALGAAILAGVGTGLYKSVPEACRAVVKVNRAVEPDAERAAEYARVYDVYRSLYPALRGAYGRLAAV